MGTYLAYQNVKTDMNVYFINTLILQICLSATSDVPQVPLANFKKALKSKPEPTYKAQLSYGEKCSSGSKVYAKLDTSQTSERREWLRRQPMAQLCEQQMEKGNYMLPACRNVTMRANLQDKYQMSVRFEKISNQAMNVTYQAYSYLRQMAFPYMYENVVNSTHQQQGKIDIQANFAPDLQSVNISMNSPNMDAEITNVRVNRWVRPVVVSHAYKSAPRRLLDMALYKQYNG